jgi:serine/threonine protein kinase/Flp pilus assembly protein TadD
MTTWNPHANELFLKALELRSPGERREFLDGACAADAALRAEVEALLEAGAQAGSFLEKPAVSALATVDEPAVSERRGTVIGSYKLLEQIGEGGFGVVFLAEQMQPVRRRVALKVLKPGMDTRQVIARFEAERQALALMDHPNIAHVFDGGATASGRPYFVMELVRGVPITEFCDQSHLSICERLELFLSVCQAVQHAHHKGIIHRDLKPSNVMVTMHDDKAVVKVIDFGIAKATGQQLTDKTLFTNFAQMIGTPLYMSPEQAQMNGLDVDTRSDIYSLGVLLYELLTGTTPFDKERLRTEGYDEIRRMIREEEPPKPSTRLSTLAQAATAVSASRRSDPKRLRQLLRGELDWIVMKALEKDRNRRYESANALAADVQRYLSDEPVLACPPSVLYRLRKFARCNKAVLVTVSVAVLAAFLVVGVVAGSLGWMARDRSVRQARLNLEGGHALDEAEKACAQALTLTDNPYQWEAVLAEAASAFKRADGLAAQPEAGLEPAVRQRLEALRVRLDADENDRRFVARFDEIRLEQSEIHEAVNAFKLEIAFPAFKKAFQSHYAIAFGATAPKEVLNLLEQRPRPIRHYLVAALEFSLAYVPREEPQARMWLAAVLAAVDSSDPWRQQARAAMEARDWQALRKHLEGPAGARQSPVVLLGLAARNPWDPKMLDLWRYIRQSYPGDFWANRFLAGVLHYNHQRLEEAIRYYTVAIALRPRSLSGYVDLGNALWGKGELDEAIVVYRQAVALAPRYAAAQEKLAQALCQKGGLDQAIAEQRQTIGFRSDSGDYCVLGRLLQYKGHLEEAIGSYKKAIELDPKCAWAHNGLGNVLLGKGQFEEAIASYKKAIELDPKYAWSHHGLGEALRHKGQREEAVASYKKAIELDPKCAWAHNGLGNALRDKGQLKEAVASYRTAIELDPKYGWAYYNLGHTLQRQGEFRKALEELRRGHELGSKDPRWRYPSAQWVRQGERLVELDAQLPDFLEGKTTPASPDERIELAGLCSLKRLHHAAAGFYAQAFLAKPKLADDLGAWHRYNAACAAALAGCGQGKVADKLDSKERARLRRQALDWLRADLEAWGQLLDRELDKTRSAARVTKVLRHWLVDPDFAGVRGPEALGKLPEAEQQSWQEMWGRVADLLKRAQGKAGPEKK